MELHPYSVGFGAYFVPLHSNDLDELYIYIWVPATRGNANE